MRALGMTASRPRNSAMKTIAALTFGLMSWSVCGAFAQSGDPIYKGKTIEWLIPANPGGGTDTSARMMAPFLHKHLPGNPVIQPFNEPAGSAILGLNRYFREPADGRNIVITSTSSTLPFLLGEKGVDYDLNQLEPLAGLPLGGLVYVRGDSPYKTAADLFNAKEQLIYGGETAIGGDTIAMLAFEVFGVDYRGIMGYDGQGAARIALEQGEVDLVYDTSASYLTKVKPLEDQGKVRPLFSFGFLKDGEIVRDPLMPDIPHVLEVYQQQFGKDPSGPEWAAYQSEFPVNFVLSKAVWVYKDASAEERKELKDAFVKMDNDPEFIERKAAELGPYKLLVGEDLSVAVKSMLTVDPEVAAWKKKWLSEKFGVKF